jgi:hypothetical protein
LIRIAEIIFGSLWYLKNPRKTRHDTPIRYKSCPIGYFTIVSTIMILNEYRKDIIDNNIKYRGTKIRIIKKTRHIRSIITVFKSDIKKVITLLIS